ncbi:E3 ubiquitin-protein ligase TRIM33-like isoform X2 [Choristoneura fumiferana]|uniref:E3 ubiquitin-protein ligase TRIM33-like isoform X2 n=1 Tax=Choristoneura fumiferana TaxID=7141 RepID=UPI003D156F76
MKSKTSPIWAYFSEIDKDSVKCELCGKAYSRRGRSTTPLRSHLRAMHPDSYRQYCRLDQAKQPEILDAGECPKSPEQKLPHYDEYMDFVAFLKHVFCECGRDSGERITVQCPTCRLQCQPANMIDQRFVLEKLCTDTPTNNGGTEREQQCNSCEDTEPATSYCTDCAEFICDNCVQAHQRLKITKDHTIKSKEEATAELQAAQPASAHDMFCSEHPQERLSLFCETCDRLTCRDCQLQHHRDHKYQFSTEMATQVTSHH